LNKEKKILKGLKMSDEIGETKMNLTWEPESNLFSMRFLIDDKVAFQVKMIPETFEKLTHDMVRTVKNYNLIMIEKYQERIRNEQATQPAPGGSLPDLRDADRSGETESGESEGDRGREIREDSPVG
jgi:hypothetical protein